MVFATSTTAVPGLWLAACEFAAAVIFTADVNCELTAVVNRAFTAPLLAQLSALAPRVGLLQKASSREPTERLLQRGCCRNTILESFPNCYENASLG